MSLGASEIWIMSSKGEILIRKNYRFDVEQSALKIFVGKLQSGIGRPPPHMEVGKVHYYNIKRSDLFFVLVCKQHVIPVHAIEVLSRLYQVCKDFCGALCADVINANFMLIEEILAEFMDYGEVQLTSTGKLKPYIQSEPVMVRCDSTNEQATSGLFGLHSRTVPANAADKPVVRAQTDMEDRRNEIFVDVIERLTAYFNAEGVLQRSSVSGNVMMKSFLIGSPCLKIGLSEPIVSDLTKQGYGGVHVDHCSYHENVSTTELESGVLSVTPPQGEFALMTYQITQDLPGSLPFRLRCEKETSEGSLTLLLQLHCSLPHNSHAVKVTVNVPLPHSTTRVRTDVGGGSAERKENSVLWTVGRMTGGTHATARIQLSIDASSETALQEMGSVSINFELAGYVCSRIHLQYVRVFDTQHSYVPYRWLRYITVPDAYIYRLT
ncbi:unnamed protein product [Owenia fusiformis]|uniref:Uncharacterized protein n=1 Tax=Owenia fusiformis TaxID=6347 RepID=A0A8J1U7C3_OWEFU|nr:unnamed protein product [Owenia fusiformis]